VLHKATARVIGVAGALIGATVGYWCVGLLARQGFHAIVLPAALPGVIAGVASRERSMWWALLYGAIGVVAALFTESRFRPFIVDSSFRYFVRHLGELQPAVMIVIGVGAGLGALLSLSFGRNRRVRPHRENGA